MNKNHYEKSLQELEVAVIIHGDAYKFFLKEPQKSLFKDDKELLKNSQELLSRLSSLATNYDVKFYMCQSGATKHNITQKDLLDFVLFIPNASIGLIDMQNQGYAYLPLK